MNSISDKQQELIERCLNNTAMLGDKELLEQYLKENADFKEAFLLQKTLQKVIRKNKPDQPLRNLLQKEGAKIKTELSTDYLDKEGSKHKVISMRRRLSMAASILLLIGVSSIFWANTNYNSPAVVTSLMEKPLKNSSMSTIEDVTALSQGKDAFFLEDYQKAESKLQLVSQQEPNLYYEAQVFLAYTYLLLEKYDIAIIQYNQIIEKDFKRLPDAFQEENKLRWNRLLAYVGNKQIETPFFKQEIQFFTNNKSKFYQKKAKNLVDKLNSPWRFIVFK